MSRRSRKKRLPTEPVETTIESLSQDGRGVTHIEGKAVFIDGALPGERVRFIYTRRCRRHDEGRVEEVLEASADRVAPRCAHFAICGGCSLQHMAPKAQIIAKQQAMIDGLKHIGKVEPEHVLAPLTGPVWGYRRKARLGVRKVIKKGRVLVGFREKRNSYVADIERCEVLDASVGLKLDALSQLIEGLDAKATLPQIEVAVADNATALVLRHLEPLSEHDCEQVVAFAKQQDYQIYLQSGGPDTVVPLYPEKPELYYEHQDYDVRIDVGPLDFYQVNADINHQMLQRALEYLELVPTDKVLDLFSGLGNFTLPIARQVAEVVGIEGDQIMVNRARATAERNGISNTRYYAADLMDELKDEPWLKERFDKILLDPPRSGAKEVIEHIGKLDAKCIVYVSCHPGTLARDAGELVHTHGYKLVSAGVMDMFPHTGHVESMAIFVRG